MKSLLIVVLLAAVGGLVKAQTVRVTILPDPLVGRAGENIIITCNGPEPVSLTLESESSPGTFTAPSNLLSREEITGGTEFTIGPLTMADNGVVFRCSFPSSPPTRDNATLMVQFPPTLTLNGEQVRTVTEGVSIEITIDITGNPAPTASDLVLSVDSGTLSVAPVLGSGTVTITFPSVSRSDSGEYTLFVSTILGDDSVTFTLNVQYPPTFEATLSDTFVCPEVNDPIVRCAGMVGSTGTLRCGVTGNPEPEVTPMTTALDTSNVDNFTITTANVNNTGIYTCTATNIVGNDTRKFELFIGRRPANVANLLVRISESRFNAIVTWDYNDPDNAVPLEGFTLQLFQGTNMISTSSPSPSDRMFMNPLAGLQTNQDYIVTLTATNLLGSSQMVAESQFQTPDEIPTTVMTTTEGASGLAASLLMSVSLAVVVVLATLLY